MKQIEITSIELWLGTASRVSSTDVEKIRGYIGNTFIEDPLFHNHKEKDKLIYRYPVVQYKVINCIPLLIGINEGIDSLWKVFEDISVLNFNNTKNEIFEKETLLKQVMFGISRLQIYTFQSPWLALNKQNYEKYLKLGNWEKRKELLEKILIGNILSISKSLGYTVEQEIRTDMKYFKEVHTTLKGNPMLGFLGRFSMNFEIPDYWGIGKSVSRGFGTIKNIL